MKIEFTSEKREAAFGAGWSRGVKVGDKEYTVHVSRGRKVRIPYKPRGQNVGFWWNGAVYLRGGGRVWAGEVTGSIGARGLLAAAGILGSTEKMEE